MERQQIIAILGETIGGTGVFGALSSERLLVMLHLAGPEVDITPRGQVALEPALVLALASAVQA